MGTRRRCRTPTQLRALEILWLHHSHKGGRQTRPSLRELAEQLRPGMTAWGAWSHLNALILRGDVEYVGDPDVHQWRRYGLTPQGVKRAKERAELMRRRAKKARRRLN